MMNEIKQIDWLNFSPLISRSILVVILIGLLSILFFLIQLGYAQIGQWIANLIQLI